MKLKQILLPAVVSLVLSLAGRSLAADTLPPLRVGITPNLPPLAFKQDGKIVGIEADFAQKLGTALGREVKFVQLDWEDQIPALLDGKTDIIMSGMSITKMRQFRVDFCAPYLQGGQMALVRRSDLNSYALGFPLTPPGVIGVEKGTTGQFFAQQEFSRCERKTFSGSEQAVKALKKKQIGLFIGDAPTIWWLASENEADGLASVPILLTSEQLAWAVNKSDPVLLTTINQALLKWQQEGQATQLIRHWLPNFQ